MKRAIAILVMLSAAVGCAGVDYGSVIHDAHDMVSQAQSVIDTECITSTTDVCTKLQQASEVSDNLLQIADFALDTGTDLKASATTAWSYAKSLLESVKMLIGVRSYPRLARAAPLAVTRESPTTPREILLEPYACSEPATVPK